MKYPLIPEFWYGVELSADFQLRTSESRCYFMQLVWEAEENIMCVKKPCLINFLQEQMLPDLAVHSILNL